MAINPDVVFPGKTAGVSPEYPYGKARDVSAPGDGTGTPLRAAWVNDWFGLQQQLLSLAGIVPSGVADAVGACQVWDALSELLMTRADLAGASGASGVGTQYGPLDDVVEHFAKGPSMLGSAPSLPAITRLAKALFKPVGIPDCLTWVVSRKSQNKAGWVAVAIANGASPSDAQNYGGASNYRPTYVINGVAFNVGKTSIFAKTAGTVLSALTAAQINSIWGYVAAGPEFYAQTLSAEVSWSARQCYDCAGVGDSVTYQIASGPCTIRFGLTNASSAAVKVLYSFDGANFLEYLTLSLKHPPSGSVFKRDVRVDVGPQTAPYYVRVENAGVGSCFVAGINIGPLPESSNLDVDNALFIQNSAVAGVPNQYQGGNGANEFAAKEASTGKFFGTYHGGHSGFLQRLRTDAASYDIDSVALPALFITGGLQLHSASTLTVGGSAYQYTAETFFGDGAHVTTFSIELASGSPIVCERVFTHMCTTMRDFEWVHVPLTIKKTDDGDVLVGDCQFIQQFRAYDAAQLNCYFSGVGVLQNANGGAYVSFQPNYNKQYYGPALAAQYQLTGGQFVTAKEYC